MVGGPASIVVLGLGHCGETLADPVRFAFGSAVIVCALGTPAAAPPPGA